MITRQIGDELRTAREAKGVTASAAAQATRIKVQHLQEMEQGDFSRIPAHTYARGFIRIYAQYLGIDPSPLVSLYNRAVEGRTETPEPRVVPVSAAPAPDPRAHLVRATHAKPAPAAPADRPEEPLPPPSMAPPPPGPRGPTPWSRLMAGLREHRDPILRVAAVVVAVGIGGLLIRSLVRGWAARRALRTPPVQVTPWVRLPPPPGLYLEPLPPDAP